MKPISVLFLLVLFFVASGLQAQSSFQIRDNNNGGVAVSDGAVFYHPTQNFGPTINHEFEIKNSSPGTLSLSLRKYEDLMNTVNVNNSDVAQAYFCFGTNCLPASVFSYSIELMPGESTLLEAKFDEASVAGHSIVRFKFNNKVNTSDALTLTLKYDSNVGLVSAGALDKASIFMGPNPVKDFLYIGSTESSQNINRISIKDADGKEVYIISGDGNALPGNIRIPLTNLANGFYFVEIQDQIQTYHQKIILNNIQ